MDIIDAHRESDSRGWGRESDQRGRGGRAVWPAQKPSSAV